MTPVMPLSFGKGPFSSTPNLDVKQACHYSDIYEVSRRSYVFFNLLEDLFERSFPTDKEDFLLSLKKSIKNVKLRCGGESIYYDTRRFVSIEQTGANKISFGFVPGTISVSGNHSVERSHLIERVQNGSDVYLVYKKSYGERKGEPLFVVRKEGEEKKYIRIISRLFSQELSNLSTFWYEGKTHNLISKEAFFQSEAHEIKSLHEIYNGKQTVLESKFKIGVIGTGLDYNHPGIAKFLPARKDIESKLIKRDIIKSRLKYSLYRDLESYNQDLKKYKNSLTGFPIWMDQSLKTDRPYDAILYNGEVLQGLSGDHETRVTSRIIEGIDEVEIHFARRDMGRFDKFTAHTILAEFYTSGVRLVNMSFGSRCGLNKAEGEEWDEVFSTYQKVVFVVSAGNRGFNVDNEPVCPAFYSRKYKNVISVTALNDAGLLASYRGGSVNYGYTVDLATKADNLLVLRPNQRRVVWSNNPEGASSVAAAQVTKMILKAQTQGYLIDAQKVKQQLISAGVYDSRLKGVNKKSNYIEERAFLDYLRDNK